MSPILGVRLGRGLSRLLAREPAVPLEVADDADDALTRLRAGRFDVLVIGPEMDDPVGLTQRASALDPDLSVLIVREPEEHARTSGILAIAPFVGARVECLATRDGPTLLGRVARAATTTRRARGYRPVAAVVAAASLLSRPAAPAPPALYVDLLRDHASMGVVVLDAALVVVEANPRARELLGGDLIGAPLPGGLRSESFGEVLRRCLTSSRRAGPERLELGEVTVEVTAAPLPAGAPGGLAVLIEDVTGRLRMERRLARACACFLAFGAEAEANIRRLTALAGELLGAGSAVYSRVVAGRLEACASWSTGVGHGGTDLGSPAAGQLAAEVLEAPDDRLVVKASSDRSTCAGRRVRVGPRAFGVLCVVFPRAYARSDEDERLTGILVGAIAVEEQRLEAERALRRSEELLARSQRVEAMGQLAGGLAHDFNNMLTAVVVNASLLVERLPPGEERDAALGVLEAAERASGVTSQLLAFGRKQVLRLAVVDLNEVVRGLRPMLDRLLGERVAITLALADGLSPVEADRGQLEQVIVNLCLNARDAMPGGGAVTISTAEVAAVEGPPHVSLTVRDNGVGMSEATLAHLFEPFFSTKAGQGTGLGLAMVDGIVRQSGGRIRVESQPGRGATFTVLLPSTRAVAAGVPPPRDPPPSRAARTILVVDDQELVLRAVSISLERAGHRVLAAGGAEEALELAAKLEGPIDVLVTDVEMPGLRGPELASRLSLTRPATKVIFMSGYTTSDPAALAPGVAFIQKPFAPRALLALVETALKADR